MYLVFDTETSGLPSFKLPLDDPSQPKLMQLAFVMLDDEFKERSRFHSNVKHIDQYDVNPFAYAAHGLSYQECQDTGIPLVCVVDLFTQIISQCSCQVAHNLKFDKMISDIAINTIYKDEYNVSWSESDFCTMLQSTEICKIPHKNGRAGNKWPTVKEAYEKLLNKQLVGNFHNATFDLDATVEIFKHLKSLETAVA